MTSVSDPVPAADPQWLPAPSSQRSLAGQRVWVTGASRGLGRAIALDLSSAGARVALTARTDASVKATCDSCDGEASICVPGSVSDDGDVARIVASIEQQWGGLDAVVNCAGISPSFSRAEDLAASLWREIIEVNLTGTFLVCQAAAAVMPHGGSMVTMSSVHARSAGGRLAAYSASKGGVEALTRALALDWADRGIRVNCVAPGYFATDMTRDLRSSGSQRSRLLAHTPLATFGVPAQLTELVRLLIGPGGSYLTGSIISVDGGWTAS